MAANGVTWYGDKILAEVQVAKNAIIDEIAFQIEAETKRNIIENNQVDTGFMLNSVYTVTSGGSTFSQARSSAKAQNPKALMGTEATAPEGGAVVAVGAEYAIHQETRRAFLYPAGESVARQAGGIITKNQLK